MSLDNGILKEVVAVLIAQEHLPFIRSWCIHHLDRGWNHIHLYDNTGSTGSARRSSVFSQGGLQQSRMSKRNVPYPEPFRHLSDTEASCLLAEAVGGLEVTVHKWRPMVRGRIVHHQAEAYAEFIRTNQGRARRHWVAFMDADEWLDSGEGCQWDALIEAAEAADVARIFLSGIRYESRVGPTGEIRSAPPACCGFQQQGNKNLVDINRVKAADIHWGWITDNHKRISPDPAQFHFKHYNCVSHKIISNESVSQVNKSMAECVFVAPLEPWLHPLEFEAVTRRLDPDMTVIEFGAGGSTNHFSNLVSRYITVEHDPFWAEYVRQMAPRAELIYSPNKTMPIIVGDYTPEYFESWSNYWCVELDHVPDLAFIDGRCRLKCAERCLRMGVPVIILKGWKKLRYRGILFSPVEIIEEIHSPEGMVVLRNLSA